MEFIQGLFCNPIVYRFASLAEFIKEEKISFKSHDSLLIDQISDEFIATQNWERANGGLTTVQKIAAHFGKIMECAPSKPAAEGNLNFREGRWCYMVTLLEPCTITLLSATALPAVKASHSVSRIKDEEGKKSPSSLRRARNLSCDLSHDIEPPASLARKSPDFHTNMATLGGICRTIDHKTIADRLDKRELLFLDDGKEVTIFHPQFYAWLEVYKGQEAELTTTDVSNPLWNAPNFLLSCLMFGAYKKSAVISGNFSWKVSESTNFLEISSLSGGLNIRCSDAPPPQRFIELTEKLSF